MAEADGDDGLALLRVAVDVEHELAAEALRPLSSVDQQRASLGVGGAAVGDLAVGVRKAHLFGHDDGDAFYRAQHAGQQGGVRAEFVHRAKLLYGLRADEGVDIHNPRQLRGARAVLAQQSAQFVEHIVGYGGVVIVRLRRVVHKRQMQDAVVAKQPLRLSRRRSRYGCAVGVDVVRSGGVGVQDDVVQHFRHIADKPGAYFGQHSDNAVFFQREAVRHLPHEFVCRQGGLAGGERGVGRGGVFGAGVEAHIAELTRHVERV